MFVKICDDIARRACDSTFDPTFLNAPPPDMREMEVPNQWLATGRRCDERDMYDCQTVFRLFQARMAYAQKYCEALTNDGSICVAVSSANFEPTDNWHRPMAKSTFPLSDRRVTDLPITSRSPSGGPTAEVACHLA